MATALPAILDIFSPIQAVNLLKIKEMLQIQLIYHQAVIIKILRPTIARAANGDMY
jgi:hypothetical protein